MRLRDRPELLAIGGVDSDPGSSAAGADRLAGNPGRRRSIRGRRHAPAGSRDDAGRPRHSTPPYAPIRHAARVQTATPAASLRPTSTVDIARLLSGYEPGRKSRPDDHDRRSRAGLQRADVPLIEAYHFGSVVYFAENIHDPEQTLQLSQALQRPPPTGHGIPLLVAIDHEGGTRIPLSGRPDPFPQPNDLGRRRFCRPGIPGGCRLTPRSYRRWGSIPAWRRCWM